MAKNRIKVCWLLLLILMYTASFTMSVGQTQARYRNTATGSVMVESKELGITSDCLVTANQEPLTILVGEMSLYKPTTVSFWLHSSGADAVGNLAWSVADKDHAQYLQITMSSGPDNISPNMEVGLLQDVDMDITMTLTPTEIARNTVHDQLKILVLVTWGEEMWGTFQVILPEVAGEENDGEDPEKIPDETVAEVTETKESDEADQLNNTQTTASYGVVSLSDAEPQNTEADGSAEETTEPTQSTTEPEETTAPTEESTEPTQETQDPTEEATQPEEPQEPEEPEEPIRMHTLARFDPDQMLPVHLYMTPDVTAVQLGLWVVNEKATEELIDPENPEEPVEPVMEFKPFPDNTKFSVNQGKSFYMMYDGYVAEFALQEQTELAVLLDFTQAELDEEETLILGMEAYVGDELVYSGQAETAADAAESYRNMTRPLVKTETETERPQATDTNGVNILSQVNTLEFNFPMEWLDAEVEYSVEFLSMTEDQTLKYTPVDLKSAGISARYVDYDLTHQLVLQVGDQLPPAGTYRLNIKWTYEGICFAHTQTTFFINYSAQINTLLGG